MPERLNYYADSAAILDYLRADRMPRLSNWEPITYPTRSIIHAYTSHNTPNTPTDKKEKTDADLSRHQPIKK